MAIYNNRLNAAFNRPGSSNLPSILGIGLALLLIAIIFMFRPNQPADGGGNEGPPIASADETPSAIATAQAEDTPVIAVTSTATEPPSTEAQPTDNVTSTPPTEQEPTPALPGVMTSTPVATFTPVLPNATEEIPTEDSSSSENPENPENEQNGDPTLTPEPTLTLPPSATVAINQDEKTDNALSASPTELPASATIAYEQKPSVSITPTEASSIKVEPTDTPAPASPTQAPPTQAPPTPVPPTQVPPTQVPPTQVPPTPVPPTPVPPTQVPPTPVPPTPIPPTRVPPTPTQPTSIRPYPIPPTSVPPTAVPRNVTLTLLSPAPDSIMKTNEVRFSFQVTGVYGDDRWAFRTGLDAQLAFDERNLPLQSEGSGIYYTDLNYRPGHTDGNGFGKDYYWQIIILSEDRTVLATSEVRKFRWEKPN